MSKVSDCTNLAKQVKALYEEGVLIGIDGIGVPSVLLQNDAFYEAFPSYDVGEITQSSDSGRLYRINTITVDGVLFKCVEYIEQEPDTEADDGLGGS